MDLEIIKGENYNIKNNKKVQVTDYDATNCRRIKASTNNDKTSNNFECFKKLNATQYLNTETGAIGNYKNYINKSLESLKKAMNTLEDILLNNFNGERNELFITLTTDKDTSDIEEIIEAKNKFVRKLKREFEDLIYVGVYELQKSRNSWHIHLIIKDKSHKLIFIDNKIISDLWGLGLTKISYISNKAETYEINEEKRLGYVFYEEFPIFSAISYLCKCETKEAIPRNYNAYFCSKNIKKPNKFYVEYGDIVEELESDYNLETEQTILVKNKENDKILNTIKEELWKKA